MGLILLITLSNDKIELVINSCFTSPLDCFESFFLLLLLLICFVFSLPVSDPLILPLDKETLELPEGETCQPPVQKSRNRPCAASDPT